LLYGFIEFAGLIVYGADIIECIGRAFEVFDFLAEFEFFGIPLDRIAGFICIEVYQTNEVVYLSALSIAAVGLDG